MAKNYDNELKDLYETGTSDKEIDMAKQKQKKVQDIIKEQRKTPFVFADEKNNEVVRQSQQPIEYKKKGGVIKKMSNGGTASSRADGCAVRGKTRA